MSVKYDAVENFDLPYKFKHIVDRGTLGLVGCCRG